MKEKLKNKKVIYTIIGIVSVLLVALAVTYAYWLVTKTQTGENEITAGCLDIAISGEKNDIELTNQFPMSDEEGMKLVPYEFTVTNNCNTSVDYQVALEATGDSSNALKGTSLKVALNDSAKLYSAYPEVDTTIEGAYESRVLVYSKLAAAGNDGSSDTYSLRIWIDKDAPISEMNKTFRSKISVTIGQGIESGFEEGTLAYSILSNVGGTGATSEIDANEYAHRVTSTGSLYMLTSENYYWGTEYKYDAETGKYTLSGTITQKTLNECRYDSNKCGKYTLRSKSSSTSEDTKLIEITNWKNSKGNLYVTANIWNYTTPFASVATTSETGLYKAQDDLGDSYYFRGAPSNNYVQFGSYAANSVVVGYYSPTDSSYRKYNTLEECNNESDYNYNCGYLYTSETPMYWRIVRINGDGTIRLVYDGTTKVENGTVHDSDIGYPSFNSNYDNAKSVGYTYDDGTGTQVDSKIKGVVDTWYETNLESDYGKYIADSIFCNDREVTNTSGSDQYYGAYQRLYTNKIPSLKCTNQSDRYTVEDTTNGNGLLSNPVGLITADEAVYAGSTLNGINQSYYLYNNNNYWTMSPSYWSDNDGCAYVWNVNEYGGLNHGSDYMDVNSGYNVSPVINLKADVKFTGDGTIDNPYVIVTE